MANEEDLLQELNEDFVLELFNIALKNKDLLEIVIDNVKDNFLPDKEQKNLLKELKTQYRVDNIRPTIGTLKQAFRKDRDMLFYLNEVRDVEVENPQIVIKSLNEFIKLSIFVSAYDEIGEIWNRGADSAESKKKCFKIFSDTADMLNNFSLNAKMFESVFGDFMKRQGERVLESLERETRIPFGIDELDRLSHGGAELGDYVLFLGDAKAGKSFCLAHCGMAAARRGFPVAHIQAEGKKKMVFNRYDAAWSGTNYYDIKQGILSETKYKAYKKIIDNIGKSDIHVYAPEKFDSITVLEIRQQIIELKKKFDIKVVIIDYMDLINPDGQIYKPNEERFRLQKTSQALKDLALSLNVLVISATQASSIDIELLNDPDFVITRRDLADDKSKVRAVDFLITINRTKEERKNKTCRLYTDALREHESGDVIYIKQNLAQSRFYDRMNTLKEFGEEMIEMD